MKHGYTHETARRRGAVLPALVLFAISRSVLTSTAAAPLFPSDLAAALKTSPLYVSPAMSSRLGSRDQASIRSLIQKSSAEPGAIKVAVLDQPPAGCSSAVQASRNLHRDLNLGSGASVVVLPHQFAAYSDSVAPAEMKRIQDESAPFFKQSLRSGLEHLLPVIAAAETPGGAGGSEPAASRSAPVPGSNGPARSSTPPASLPGSISPPAALPAEPAAKASAATGWLLVLIAAIAAFVLLRRRKGDLAGRKSSLTDFGYTVSEKIRGMDDLLPRLPDFPGKEKAVALREQAGISFSEGMQALGLPLTAQSLDSAHAALKRSDTLLEQAQQSINAAHSTPPTPRP